MMIWPSGLKVIVHLPSLDYFIHFTIEVAFDQGIGYKQQLFRSKSKESRKEQLYGNLVDSD